MTDAARLDGWLNIDKPPGITSRDVVNHVQRLVRPAKAGHAGTLDPLATGVLVVGVGAATRLVEYVQRMPKRYVGTFLLGRESPTDDVDGDVTVLTSSPRPTPAEVQSAVARFVGEMDQRPPAYSALKVQGRRAYQLARRGENVQLAPRRIVIHKLEVVRYAWPELVLDVQCGSGTYLRALGRDLAEALDTKAVMSALVREAVGTFRRDEAVPLDSLAAQSIASLVLPLGRAVPSLPSRVLTDEELARVRQGRSVPLAAEHAGAAELAGYDSHGRLVAILAPREPGCCGPTRNLG